MDNNYIKNLYGFFLITFFVLINYLFLRFGLFSQYEMRNEFLESEVFKKFVLTSSLIPPIKDFSLEISNKKSEYYASLLLSFYGFLIYSSLVMACFISLKFSLLSDHVKIMKKEKYGVFSFVYSITGSFLFFLIGIVFVLYFTKANDPWDSMIYSCFFAPLLVFCFFVFINIVVKKF